MPRRKTPGTPRVARSRKATARRVRGSAARTAPRKKPRVVAAGGGLTVTEAAELATLRRQIERMGRAVSAPRWNADPDDVQRSVAALVLTLVEFIRRLLERQAIRRMEAGTITPRQTEDVGRALMQLEETVRELADRFGVSPEDLQLDLGPVGRLM